MITVTAKHAIRFITRGQHFNIGANLPPIPVPPTVLQLPEFITARNKGVVTTYDPSKPDAATPLEALRPLEATTPEELAPVSDTEMPSKIVTTEPATTIIDDPTVVLTTEPEVAVAQIVAATKQANKATAKNNGKSRGK